MESKVMAVAAMSGCFVSLPLSLIQVLESTARGTLPPVLALELRPRSRSGDGDRWHVAWSGSASSSSAIEVSKQFAECISLPDSSDVLVKPVANSPKAKLVTIEPDSEDDWEILELNSEIAEEVILKQIGIVYEGMRFPLWLHGHIVVIFRVISTSPAISVGVYLKKYSSKLKRDVSSMRLSPISFKISGRKTSINSDDVADASTHSMSKRRPTGVDPLYIENMEDCSFHDYVQASSADFDVGYDSENNITLDNQCLVRAWLIGQLMAIASHVSGMNTTKIILAKETLFHFKLKDLKSENNSTEQIHNSVVKGTTRVASTEVMYLLTTNFEEASNAGQHCFYELVLKAENDVSNKIECKPCFSKLEWGDPVFLDTPMDNMIEKSFGRMVSCPNWLETAASAVIHRLMAPLCRFGKLLSSPDISLPGHVLIHGPPGSGKTSLAISLSNYLRRHEEILAHTVFVSCSKLALERSRSLRKAVAGHVLDAMLHSPSVVIFDDLDDVVSSSGGSELAEFLANIIDSYRKIVYDEKNYGSCRYGPIVCIASVKNFANLPQILTSSGRFDFHLQVPALTVSGRRDILKHIISMRDLDCSEDVFSDVTTKLDGYDAHDLVRDLFSKASSAAPCLLFF